MPIVVWVAELHPDLDVFSVGLVPLSPQHLVGFTQQRSCSVSCDRIAIGGVALENRGRQREVVESVLAVFLLSPWWRVSSQRLIEGRTVGKGFVVRLARSRLPIRTICSLLSEGGGFIGGTSIEIFFAGWEGRRLIEDSVSTEVFDSSCFEVLKRDLSILVSVEDLCVNFDIFAGRFESWVVVIVRILRYS